MKTRKYLKFGFAQIKMASVKYPYDNKNWLRCDVMGVHTYFSCS